MNESASKMSREGGELNQYNETSNFNDAIEKENKAKK